MSQSSVLKNFNFWLLGKLKPSNTFWIKQIFILIKKFYRLYKSEFYNDFAIEKVKFEGGMPTERFPKNIVENTAF